MPRAAASSASSTATSATPQADAPATSSATQPASYEAALAELEALVASMEDAALPLDRLLSSYRRAAELLNFCRDRLSDVETQVKVLENGQLRSWQPDA